MRYFLELSYKGTAYSGFQVQENAHTIQAELENTLAILFRERIELTGSSRTDAGVHALQNYFHFDLSFPLGKYRLKDRQELVYKLNAILPSDISVRSLREAGKEAHCRFDAVYREYNYYLSRNKNPFVRDRSWYFPYALDLDLLQEVAGVLMEYQDFTSFSKKNTQAKTFQCRIMKSEWMVKRSLLIYKVRSDRFLRGMVRALTASMLDVGKGKTSIADFRSIIEGKDCARANFAAPAQGLFLMKVAYPSGYFE